MTDEEVSTNGARRDASLDTDRKMGASLKFCNISRFGVRTLPKGIRSLCLEKKNKQHDHDDVDDWLYQADCHAMPVLHADCISNDGGVWRYEDPFASDVTPKM